MKKSRFATIRCGLGTGFFVLAMTLAGCDSGPSMAPERLDTDLVVHSAQAPADKAMEVNTTFVAEMVGPLAGMPLAGLPKAIVEGRAYVNVHTYQYPGGEIRGTIR